MERAAVHDGTNDLRKHRVPAQSSEETAYVGELIMRYKHPVKENKFDVYSGTGTLYAKLDDKHYIVVTAAHNLVSV